MELFGLMILNSVHVAVVTNYFTQCEMILFYVKGITLRLQEKSTDLKTAMKVSHEEVYAKPHIIQTRSQEML